MTGEGGFLERLVLPLPLALVLLLGASSPLREFEGLAEDFLKRPNAVVLQLNDQS